MPIRFYLSLLLSASFAFLGACTTPVNKEYTVSGGNKNAGLIELSFQYTTREDPQVSPDQPGQLASERCQMWGYTEAQMIGIPELGCALQDGSKCLRMRSTIKYQCQ